MLLCADVYAQELIGMSLEDLMNVEVYSAAKKSERISDTPAAISVITSEDIRRSGATSIPELLRMVPGVQVQKVDSHTWDISTRGFNGSLFANKLLVLIDGRSVYAPLYGGVIWYLQDVVLEDIERIEVIRGPGGALWGANAVNGVINIITKKAEDTQGGLAVVGGGTEERGFATTRYGGKTKEGWFYRAYAKYLNRDNGFRPDGNNVDSWNRASGGFRAEKEKLTVQGDYYEIDLGQRTSVTSFTSPFTRIFKERADGRGWNLLSTYKDDDWMFRMYWDATDLQNQALGERRDQIDLEYTRQAALTDVQEINWGLGYRLIWENMNNTDSFSFVEPEDTDQIFSAFIQDEIKATEKLKFTLGNKLEHNIYTGFEFQPSVRALYRWNDKFQMWGAASRAIRTPARLETDGTITTASTVPVYTRINGNRDLSSEKLRAFEVGFRHQPTANLYYDVTAFSNYYDRLMTFDLLGLSLSFDHGFPVLNVPTVNGMKGEVHGIELSGNLKLKEWWTLKGYYALTAMNLKMDYGLKDSGLARFLNDGTSRNTAYLRSSFDLPHGFELDTTFRYASEFVSGRVPAVAEIDVNLTRKFSGWEVAFVGQNLIEEQHKESVTSTATQVERGYYLKVTRRF